MKKSIPQHDNLSTILKTTSLSIFSIQVVYPLLQQFSLKIKANHSLQITDPQWITKIS